MNQYPVKDITVTRTHQGVVAICYANRDHSRRLHSILRLSQQNLDTRFGLMSYVNQIHNLCTPQNCAKTISKNRQTFTNSLHVINIHFLTGSSFPFHFFDSFFHFVRQFVLIVHFFIANKKKLPQNRVQIFNWLMFDWQQIQLSMDSISVVMSSKR